MQGATDRLREEPSEPSDALDSDEEVETLSGPATDELEPPEPDDTDIEQRWAFNDILDDVERILEDFEGEESLKRLFWTVLSYDRVRRPGEPRKLPLPIARWLSHLEVFAEQGSVVIFYGRADGFERAPLEQLCRCIDQAARSYALVLDAGDDGWWVVLPDARTKFYLRLLRVPGTRRDRQITVRALAALNAMDLSTGAPLHWLQIARYLDVFFPGPMPRMRTTMPEIERYLWAISKYPLLTRHQERGEDLRGDEQPPDGSGMDYRLWRLVMYNLRFVTSEADKYPPCDALKLEDIIQEGNVGLAIAAERYDARQGNKFISYATHWVHQRITSAYHESYSFIRWPENRAAELIRANRSGHTDGLDPGELLVRRFENDEEYELPDQPHENEDLAGTVEGWLRLLDPRDSEVLRRYFGLGGMEEASLKDIGSSMGITRERARQLKERALSRLREVILRVG